MVLEKDDEFRKVFNTALAKVMANPAKMLERVGEYGYDKAQLPPADMTTEWLVQPSSIFNIPLIRRLNKWSPDFI